MHHNIIHMYSVHVSWVHDEIRDVTANLLSFVCHNVSVELTLQPISDETLAGASVNTQDGARSDISASGFWDGRFERAFFDIRVFNPHAQSNRHIQLSACYRRHENTKKRAYEQRIHEVEHASFTPLVMSLTGGLGREATSMYKRLASLLSTKCDQPYSKVMGWLRCWLSFSLLHSSVLCIRGTCSSSGHFAKPLLPVDLMTCES